MKYKNGDEIEQNDVIRWHCHDSDDGCTWVMTGIYQFEKVVYLGGGVDFGTAFGKKMDAAEVIEMALDNDGDQAGLEKVGTAMDIVQLISHFKGEC